MLRDEIQLPLLPSCWRAETENSSGSFSKGRWCQTGRSQGLAARQLPVGLLDLPSWKRRASVQQQNSASPLGFLETQEVAAALAPSGPHAAPPTGSRAASPGALRAPHMFPVSGLRKPHKSGRTQPGEIPDNSSVGSCEQPQVQSRLVIYSASQRCCTEL